MTYSSLIDFFKKYRLAFEILLVLACIFWVYRWYTTSIPVETAKQDQPVTVSSKTSVAVVPKVSANDNDLELKQTYRANVNGTSVAVPMTSKGQTKDGSKAIVTQEIDLTNVLSLQRKADEKEFKKNWEIGAGVGCHDGEIYIPVEVQRNYAKDKALSIELHLEADKIPPVVNGAEIKHKWLIN